MPPLRRRLSVRARRLTAAAELAKAESLRRSHRIRSAPPEPTLLLKPPPIPVKSVQPPPGRLSNSAEDCAVHTAARPDSDTATAAAPNTQLEAKFTEKDEQARSAVGPIGDDEDVDQQQLMNNPIYLAYLAWCPVCHGFKYNPEHTATILDRPRCKCPRSPVAAAPAPAPAVVGTPVILPSTPLPVRPIAASESKTPPSVRPKPRRMTATLRPKASAKITTAAAAAAATTTADSSSSD